MILLHAQTRMTWEWGIFMWIFCLTKYVFVYLLYEMQMQLYRNEWINKIIDVLTSTKHITFTLSIIALQIHIQYTLSLHFFYFFFFSDHFWSFYICIQHALIAEVHNFNRIGRSLKLQYIENWIVWSCSRLFNTCW